ncbi:MAG: carbon storage regulator CsrA [Gammaproteobacteria bacterium]
MLILTRSMNERIFIGDNISVAVLQIKGGQVRIGIEAPKKIPVHREEVLRKIKPEIFDDSLEHED